MREPVRHNNIQICAKEVPQHQQTKITSFVLDNTGAKPCVFINEVKISISPEMHFALKKLVEARLTTKEGWIYKKKLIRPDTLGAMAVYAMRWRGLVQAKVWGCEILESDYKGNWRLPVEEGAIQCRTLSQEVQAAVCI